MVNCPKRHFEGKMNAALGLLVERVIWSTFKDLMQNDSELFLVVLPVLYCFIK